MRNQHPPMSDLYSIPRAGNTTCDLSLNQSISQWYSFFLLIFSSLVLVLMLIKLFYYVYAVTRYGRNSYHSRTSSDNYFAIGSNEN